MRKNEDYVAIYSRKSRFTGKGESIGNQIELCREYVRVHFGDAAMERTAVFEDEGFSGLIEELSRLDIAFVSIKEILANSNASCRCEEAVRRGDRRECLWCNPFSLVTCTKWSHCKGIRIATPVKRYFSQ